MSEPTGQDGHPLYSEEILAFVRSGNALCSWLEELDPAQPGGFIREAVGHLSAVYHHITLLRQPEPMLEGGNEKYVTEEDWSGIYRTVQQALGPHNEYLRMADNEEFDRSDLVEHKISEDLADIYQDIRDFTMQFRQGLEEIMNDALYEVMVNFEQYWGEKLINSLGALHRLMIRHTDLENQDWQQLPGADDETGGPPAYDNTMFRKFQDRNKEDT